MKLVGIFVDVGTYSGKEMLDGSLSDVFEVKIQTQKGDLCLILKYTDYGTMLEEFQNIEIGDKVAIAYTIHVDADNEQVFFLKDIKRFE